MTSGQKVAFSLLISVLAFCAFTVVAFSGLFDILEVNFYQPIVQEIKQKKIDEISAAQNEYFQTLIKRFDAFTIHPDVKTYVETRPSDSAVRSREALRSSLLTSTEALSQIRIIDDNGRNIYFSTFSSDVISTKNGISYRNYDSSPEISYDSVRAKNNVTITADSEKKCRLIKDGERNYIIFSLPFYNSSNSFVGTALFYCDASNFSKFLFNRSLIDMNGFALLVTDSKDKNGNLSGFGGFVFGLPNFGQSSIKKQLIEKWRNSPDENFWKIVPEYNSTEEKSEKSVCAFSQKPLRNDFAFITLIYDENELKFPSYIRLLLLVTAFVTFYLAVFLILSFRHDDIVVIKDKVRRYESEFFIGCRKMGEMPSSEYLSEQKNILESRILKSLGKKGQRHASEFKSIFENTWNELVISFVPQNAQVALSQNVVPQINADELKKIVRSSLEDILENGKIQINAASITTSSIQNAKAETSPVAQIVDEAVEETEPADEFEETEIVEGVEEAEPAEEIEDAEPAEDVEEAEPAEEIEEAETVEEVEDAEPAEDVEEAESAEEVEDAEPAEEIEEAEPAEEVEEAESAEEVEDAEPAEEIEDAEPAEEVEEAESVEEIEDAEPAEEIGDAVPAEEVEETETVEEVEEAASAEEVEEEETVEDVEEVETAEDIEDAEPAEDVEEAESIEEVEEAAPAEEIEDAEPAEEVEEAESVEEIEDAEPAEEVEEAESVEEVEDAEPAEEIEEAEPAEELEDLPEVSEEEEQSIEISKTLAALPEQAPQWNDNDEVELDSFGLSRQLSDSEKHDIQKLKDASKKIDEMENNLEELESLDSDSSETEETTDSKLEKYAIHSLDENSADEDDVYKDEVLLEKIEFGIPESDEVAEDIDDSVADNFVAEGPDFSFLDDDSEDEMYETEFVEEYEPKNMNENEIPAENLEENKDDSIVEENLVEEIPEVSEEELSAEEISEVAEETPVEELPTEELSDDYDDVGTLQDSEENMPFMFTQFGSVNAQVSELSPVLSDAIVQDSDGTFHVTEMKSDLNVNLDMNFKRLVDSILR